MVPFLSKWDEEDPVTSQALKVIDLYKSSRELAYAIRKKHGTDRMAYWWQQEEIPEYVEGKTDYTNRQKELMADDWLKKDTKRELCRTCGEKGEETGKIRWEDELDKNKKPVLDEEGKKVQIGRPQLQCPKRHKWYTGEGKARGIAGDNPILFEEHLRSRQKREIYVTVGVPDPSIESGIYNRVHKDGRKVNTKEQRSKHGASFYR